MPDQRAYRTSGVMVRQISLPRQVQPPKDLRNRFPVREQRELSVFGLMGVPFVSGESFEVTVIDQRNLAPG
jgi:hypothetical protein